MKKKIIIGNIFFILILMMAATSVISVNVKENSMSKTQDIVNRGGSIGVYVHDQYGDPVSNAMVIVWGGSYGLIFRFKNTDSSGKAIFNGLQTSPIPIGYKVKAFKSGYITLNGGNGFNPSLSNSNPYEDVTCKLHALRWR